MKTVIKLFCKNWVFFAILCIGTFLGLYQLDTLPAEMWGDATAHYALAENVRHGYLFYNYAYGGDGPIYTYLVVLVSWFLGLSFYTLKFTSVLIYLLFIIVMYYLTEAIFKKKGITYIACFLTTVSFWSLTFARQPHARILVPLFVATTMLFAVKKKPIVSGIFLGLGMYTQASFWAMPLIFWKKYKILLIGIIITIPLVISFTTGGVGFFTNQSYFGEKLAVTDNYTNSQIISNLVSNVQANFFSFFLRGDEGFRLNVPDSPQLDSISALFLFNGFFLLLRVAIKEKSLKYIEFIILPFLLIQIPSILDVHNPQAQPNIGRMIGVTPFVYIMVAYGLTSTWNTISNNFTSHKTRKIIYYGCISYLLCIIAVVNIYKYYVIYPNFLPDQNTPFARIIAQNMDTYPQKTIFYVIGSNWSEWGQPEQNAITDSISVAHTINFIQPTPLPSNLCSNVQNSQHSVVFVTSPTDTTSLQELKTCGKKLYVYTLQKNSYQVANMIEIQ